jgi:glycosyltransferase involved in cell wall biosynthesis
VIGIEMGLKNRSQKLGGRIYKQYLYEMLQQNEYDFVPMNIILNKKRNNKVAGLVFFLKLLSLSKTADLFIREFQSIASMNYDRTMGKNLGILHHIDTGYTRSSIINETTDKLVYNNVKDLDLLITVSEYWKNHFQSYSDNIKVIYNPFDFPKYNVSENAVNSFLKRYNLLKKPVIYIGNCRENKGVTEVYEKIKNIDAYIVTSGLKEVDIPAIHLDLSFTDYNCLLTASSVVVTMSKFKEGWGRTTHEAMICKTPVIGSGGGGMRELLVGGNQIICDDMGDLKDNVLHAMNNPELGLDGYRYATQNKFSIEHFQNSFKEVIDSLL